jgi:hypothetical protein
MVLFSYGKVKEESVKIPKKKGIKYHRFLVFGAKMVALQPCVNGMDGRSKCQA